MRTLSFILISICTALLPVTANTLCETGKNQSPINIDSSQAARAFNRLRMGLKFNYGQLNPKTIVNTGNGLRLFVEEGANIQIDGQQFFLKALDFHMPSEHTVNGRHFPLEIQFLHESAQQDPAIVSMMFIPGKADRTLRKLIQQQLPTHPGKPRILAANTLKNLEMKKKLANYYRYTGSLTTPPCREGVRWFIMQQPLTIADEQQQALKAAIGKENNRPVQPLHARRVTE